MVKIIENNLIITILVTKNIFPVYSKQANVILNYSVNISE